MLLAALVGGLVVGPRWPAALALGLAVALLVVPDPRLLLGTLAALLAGAVLADARLAALDRSALVLGPLHGRATLLEHPRTRSFGTRIAAVRVRGERVLLEASSRVHWPATAAPGVVLDVGGELVPLRPFDAYERLRGAHALWRASSIGDSGARRGGLLGVLDGVRARSERALTAGLPVPEGELARGMVLGQDGALDDQLRDDFRTSGLAHLVAASGANIALLAALVLALGALAGLGLSARLWLALAVVGAYVPLAGGGPSIQRAAIMGGAGLIAALAGRPASRWYALLLAASLTLVCNPRSAQDVGWQLSFAAVLALLALGPAIRGRLVTAGLPHALADAVAVTAAATAGTGPLIALHFESLSLVSLPANVLAAPAVAPVMWLGTLAGVLGQVAPALAQPVAAVTALPLAYLTWLAGRAAALPFAQVGVPSPGPVGALAAYAAAGLAALAWRRLPRAARRGAAALFLVGAIGAVAGVAWHARAPAAPRDLTVSFLDVGQGDATLIQHGGAAVLVDTGPPGAPVLARLRAAGVRRLNVLVLTHDALDHDGGAPAVLGHLPVGLVLDGEEATPHATIRKLASADHVRRIASDAGQVLRAGPIELDVLWPHRLPTAPPGAEPNDRATVLHVRDGAFDLLLTADAESNVVAGLDLPVVEAIKVPHHGSDDPGLPGLLSRLRPQIAVIEVGAHNTYGHPTPSTLAALHAAVPIVRRTDRGTVRLTIHDGRMRVTGGQ